MLFYRAALPLSSRTLNFTAGVVRRHLKASSWQPTSSSAFGRSLGPSDSVAPRPKCHIPSE